MIDDELAARDQRVALATGPRWFVRAAVATTWLAVLLAVAALVTVVLGRVVGFDAAAVASGLGIAAVAVYVAWAIVAASVSQWRRWQVVVDPTFDVPDEERPS